MFVQRSDSSLILVKEQRFMRITYYYYLSITTDTTVSPRTDVQLSGMGSSDSARHLSSKSSRVDTDTVLDMPLRVLGNDWVT